MITDRSQIDNWLTIAIQQSAYRYEEFFYFDKKEREFFSVVIADYFLLDEDFKINPDVVCNYSAHSAHTAEKLADKIRQIENGNAEIIPIPRLGPNLDKELVLNKIDSFLKLNTINIENATIWLP